MVQEWRIQNRDCLVYRQGNDGPVIFWGTFYQKKHEAEIFIEKLKKSLSKQEFLLVIFYSDDWNRDFSPWEAPAVFGEEGFAGGGKETLRWLLEDGIPFVEKQYGRIEEKYLIGYSLAGLFALWNAYETDLFSGIASCSGSLWFPKWDCFVSHKKINHICSIYLSLGDKEEKTKNCILSSVGERTRKQEILLRENEMVQNVVLEWNQGGHFANPEDRLVKGIKWLLEQKKQD